MNAVLPEAFADLASFVPEFAQATAFARDAVRGSASLEHRQAFYTSFGARLVDAMGLLDQTALADHNEQERNLMLLALTYAHVAQSIEVQGPDEPKHTLARARLPITRAPADL